MDHHGTKIDSVKGYDIIDCEQCGFVHIDPIPTDAELKAVYADEYYTGEKPLFIDRQIEDLDWWNTVYDERYDAFETLLSPTRRKVLDVGCGPGYFLKRGLERGWKALGIEPSKQACGHARSKGIDVLDLFLNDDGLTTVGEKFDVVHLSEVLEHVANPERICRMARDLLTPDGILCVVVPNDYNTFQQVLRERLGFRPYWLAPPFHINYFSFGSLERLLKTAGFRIDRKHAMFPMELFLLMGDNYVGNDALGRSCHGKRKRLDVLLEEPCLKAFKREFYELLARHGLGREMVVYGRKEGI
jgi:SAM-dependent methyltransferase